jgi:putative membrane protein
MNVAMLLGALGHFILYFVGAVVLTGLFILIYSRVTPWDEFALIRNGSNAAAISFAGALIGFILPLASAIAHSVGYLDMIVWGIVALVVQLLAFLMARVLDRDLKRRIEAGETAAATKLGALALGSGVLNAACMTY